MIKLSPAKSVLSSLSLFTLISCLCTAEAFGQGTAAARTEQSATEQTAAGEKGSEQSTAQPAAGPSTVVGRIGTYVITRKELEERLMTELHPYDEDFYDESAKPADGQSVLMKMIAEKAMIMEARKQNFLQDEMVTKSVKRFRDTRLVNLLAQKYLEKNKDKITATEDEIKQRMQADPKLDQARAKAEIERAKAGKLLDEYYTQIHTKSGLKKLSQYFPKAIEVYQRLLRQPREPRKVPWIQNSQIKTDLAPSEENTVLAVFASGQITLKDWLGAYCDIVPPRRPVIDTPKAVDDLLESALRMPLLVWEASSLGLDKDQELVKQVTDYEDRRLLSEATVAKQKEAKEPTTEEITAYFNENKEVFGTSKQLKIDLIWCEDLATARKAKAELDAGKDFEAVREQYSLEKKGQAFQTQPGSEGLFWNDLWAGEAGSILGPLKGFYARGIKWRIVKILEKTPGQVIEATLRPESQWVSLQILGRAVTPSKFIGTWLEQLADGTIASELRIAPKKIEWQLENGEKPLEVTMYAVEDNNDTIAYDETIVTGMSASTGLDVVSGRLNVVTGTRKVTIKIKDNMLVVEKTGVPQQRQGMTVTPLPEEHRFKASEGKPVLSKGSKELLPEMESQVKDRMTTERRKELVAEYNNELLKKYPFQIYADRIKDIDPLDIP